MHWRQRGGQGALLLQHWAASAAARAGRCIPATRRIAARSRPAGRCRASAPSASRKGPRWGAAQWQGHVAAGAHATACNPGYGAGDRGEDTVDPRQRGLSRPCPSAAKEGLGVPPWPAVRTEPAPRQSSTGPSGPSLSWVHAWPPQKLSTCGGRAAGSEAPAAQPVLPRRATGCLEPAGPPTEGLRPRECPAAGAAALRPRPHLAGRRATLYRSALCTWVTAARVPARRRRPETGLLVKAPRPLGRQTPSLPARGRARAALPRRRLAGPQALAPLALPRGTEVCTAHEARQGPCQHGRARGTPGTWLLGAWRPVAPAFRGMHARQRWLPARTSLPVC